MTIAVKIKTKYAPSKKKSFFNQKESEKRAANLLGEYTTTRAYVFINIDHEDQVKRV